MLRKPRPAAASRRLESNSAPESVRDSDASSAAPGLIDHLTTGVLVLDRGSVIEQMNSAVETLLDTSMQAARGAPLSELVAAGEPKTLKPEVGRYLETLDWPGNVRQLENACRWLTVMASGSEIHLEDLPPELRGAGSASGDIADDWEVSLRRWAEHRIGRGDETLLDNAMPKFESVLIKCALGRTGGRRQESARLLGWGRNTLTRKIKELGLDV